MRQWPCPGLARFAPGPPAFLVECYDPAHDQIGEHYPVRPGDIGMHIFIGPPTQRIPGFSRDVFALVMRFLFDRLNAARVVVEPTPTTPRSMR